MQDRDISFITTETREDNPKVVFFYHDERLINPIAVYLSERSVDLYSGKVLSDAFFGDYFIYAGETAVVADFIAAEARQLPKTLLLLTDFSDKTEMAEILSKHPQIKIVPVNGGIVLTADDARQVIEFFLGSGGQKMTLMQKSGPGEISIVKDDKQDFKTQDTKAEKPAVAEKEIDQDILKGQLPQVIKQSPVDQTVQTVRALYNTHSPKPTRSAGSNLTRTRLSVFLAAVLVLVTFIVFPLLLIVSEVSVAAVSVYLGKRALADNRLGQARIHMHRAERFLDWGGQQVALLEPVAELFRQRDLGLGIGQMFSAGRHSLSGIAKFVEAGEKSELLFAVITGKERGVVESALIADIKGSLVLADSEFGQAEAELKTPTFKQLQVKSFMFPLIVQLEKATEKISVLRRKIDTTKGVMQLLPEIVGIGGERTFLIVFQNNMELRPTGGFIGSFGLVKFTDGLFKDFTVEDVYVADGSLRGHVDPPQPLRDVLGVEHWYMRDANWDPDFERSGTQLKWFLEKELDVTVDGVIGVDVAFVEKLLEVTGPVALPDAKETITTENIYAKLQSEVHADFFPGSTKKRDVLSELGRALFLKLVEEKGVSWPVLLSELDESLSERHLLVYFPKPEPQAKASQLGWTGKIGKLPSCITAACVSDYQLVVDANLGVNKANYYIKREVAEKVVLDEDKITHILNLIYTNEATPDIAFGGTYKNYTRVYAPSASTLISASIDSVQLKITDDEVASVSAATTGAENSLTVFAALLEVLPEEKKTLTLTYQMPVEVAPGFPLQYLYKVQKQPGTKADNYHLDIGYPQAWKPVAEAVSANVAGVTTLVKNAGITYNTSLSEDQHLEFTFIK